jgi:hypothetical protein
MMDIGSNSCFVTDASCLNVDHGYSIASSICNTPYFKTVFFFFGILYRTVLVQLTEHT